ncbi:hypothetical protein [Paenibacillus sp. FSL R7-0179]|uniref:hypothetical protein n=1 Tax=Paenibacillus sp. FSL R7-0179 TaxID=2921672 RepID=UPI0030FAFFE3
MFISRLKNMVVSSVCLSALIFSVIPASAAGVQESEPVQKGLTETSNPMLDKQSENIIGQAVKVDDSSIAKAKLAVAEIKIYGPNNFWGVTYDGISTNDFTSTTYNNIQINSWANAYQYNEASGQYKIQLKKKISWLSTQDCGTITYPYGTDLGTYVGTWSNVGTGTFYANIWHNSSPSSQKIDGQVTVYEKN